MTRIAVSIPVDTPADVATALGQAGDAVQAGASLIEWRIDEMIGEAGDGDHDEAVQAVARLVGDAPRPSIVTCRPSWEGGAYRGTEHDRRSLMHAVAGLDRPPRYIDIELRAWQADAAWRDALGESFEPPDGEPAANADAAPGTRPRLILSSHDFDQRPTDLLRRVETMVGEPLCAVIKLAWRARSLRDNLQAFDLLSDRHKPAIVQCMGPFGRMSRILAGKFNGLLTYAAADADAGTAPGQLTVMDMVNRYRFNAVTPTTRVYGVIGWPVDHSLGPVLHNAGFDAVGHDGVYLHLPIPAEYEHFKATVGELIDHPRLDFRGASVTMPHKSHLLRFVTERGGRVDRLAERIGAANTLSIGSAGAMGCMNTDAPAIVDALCDAIGCSPDDLANLRITILGAGGVARAAVIALADCGAAITIVNRTDATATALADELSAMPTADDSTAHVHAGHRETWRPRECDVIINATPIGMAGGPDASASPLTAMFGRDIDLDDRHTVFDTVYTPARTPLLVDAEARGARIVTGAELFLRQAAHQFEQWTGRAAPMDVFRRVFADAEDC